MQCWAFTKKYLVDFLSACCGKSHKNVLTKLLTIWWLNCALEWLGVHWRVKTPRKRRANRRFSFHSSAPRAFREQRKLGLATANCRANNECSGGRWMLYREQSCYMTCWRDANNREFLSSTRQQSLRDFRVRDYCAASEFLFSRVMLTILIEWIILMIYIRLDYVPFVLIIVDIFPQFLVVLSVRWGCAEVTWFFGITKNFLGMFYESSRILLFFIGYVRGRA